MGGGREVVKVKVGGGAGLCEMRGKRMRRDDVVAEVWEAVYARSIGFDNSQHIFKM